MKDFANFIGVFLAWVILLGIHITICYGVATKEEVNVGDLFLFSFALVVAIGVFFGGLYILYNYKSLKE